MANVAICAACQGELPLPVPNACPVCAGQPLLAGRYTLIDRIGQGSFGTTFRAHATGGGEVAIKELLVRQLDTFKTEELFAREAEVLRALHHPGIPHFVEHFSAGAGRQTGFYLVTEFIDGPTLKQELLTRRPTEDGVIAILAELSEIIAYLHEIRPPVVHRDLKPANVMRGHDGRLKLIDFGAVKSITKDPDEGGSTVAGTFGYMAPELFAGIAEPASDVYAVGVVAVELLSGRGPQSLIDDQNRLQWQGAVAGISPSFRHLLSLMLAPNRKERPQSGRALAELVAALREGRLKAPASVDARPDTAAEQGELLKESLAALGRADFTTAFDKLGRLGQPGAVPERPLGPPPPPTPRAIPRRFAKQASAGAHIARFLGAIFAAVGFFMVGVAGVLATTPSDIGDDMAPVWLFFGLGAFFGLPGGLMTWFGQRRLAHLERVWREGETAVAVVTDLGWDRSVTVNGRNPNAITVSFVAGGRQVEARVVRWGRGGLNVGSETHVLFDPQGPTVCLIYPLPEST